METCREYAIAMLASGHSITKPSHFLKYAPKTGIKIPALVVEYIDALEAIFRTTTGVVALPAAPFRSFGLPPAVSAEEIGKWLKSFGWSDRTRNNNRDAILSFSNWARDHKYLPEGVPVEVSKIKKLEVTTDIKIFPVAAVAKLMAALVKEKPELVPYAAIGLFAGVRPAEISRLKFEEAIRWDFGDIEIRKDQSKTGLRRLAKIQPNLAEWLAPYRDAVGLIAPCDADEKLAQFVKKKGIGWSQDVMRHSFISYAVAMPQQIG